MLAYPDVTFSKRQKLVVTGVDIELIESGCGHTKADVFVWLPKEQLVFSGDIVFTDRLLGIMAGTGLKWMSARSYLGDELRPVTVIPAHGNVATLDKAIKDSLGDPTFPTGHKHAGASRQPSDRIRFHRRHLVANGPDLKENDELPHHRLDCPCP